MTRTSPTLRHTCRACTSPLEEILSLGDLRLNAFPPTLQALETVPRVPLILMVCTGCGLIQLDRTVPPDLLYRYYYYRSGVNETMVAELQEIVESACQLVPLGAGDVVLDIGANDGTLLRHYRNLEAIPFRVGVDPARNLRDELRGECDHLINEYFPHADLDDYQGKISIVTAIACAYDTDDPRRFFQVIHDLLAPGGLAVIQFQDFEQQLACAAVDNVCHEHLLYYSLWSLIPLLRDAGLSVERCRQTPINGGSLRLHLRRLEDGFPADRSVAYQLLHEAQASLDTPTIRGGDRRAFERFRQQVARARSRVSTMLELAREAGMVIDVYGASTKGNILLQLLGVGPREVRQAIDRSPQKAGLLTITGIPIVAEAEGRKEPADLWLTPIWQFRESVLRREAWYLEQGGTILFPLPTTELVRREPAMPEGD